MLWAILFFLCALLVVVIILAAIGCWQKSRRGCRRRCNTGSSSSSSSSSSSCCPLPIYGDFIRPFTFDDNLQLPIVQPGGSLIFPVPVVPPVGVTYVEDDDRVGLLVPQGVYLVSWELNPSTGAAVNLLVNGANPQSVLTDTVIIQYNYAQAIAIGPINFQYLVTAPLATDNLISLVNGGDSLFTLENIPNTAVGATSFLTHIRVQRIAPLPLII